MTPLKKTRKTAPAAAPGDRAETVPVMLTREGEAPKPLPKKAPEKGIGGRIKEARLRKENDLTIEALSRMCKLVDPIGQGIAQPTIVRYEKGEVLPGARELRVLSDALAVSTDFLILGRERNGIVDMGVALSTLSRMLHERLTAENPLIYPPPSIFDDRPKLIAKAKEPKARK